MGRCHETLPNRAKPSSHETLPTRAQTHSGWVGCVPAKLFRAGGGAPMRGLQVFAIKSLYTRIPHLSPKMRFFANNFFYNPSFLMRLKLIQATSFARLLINFC